MDSERLANTPNSPVGLCVGRDEDWSVDGCGIASLGGNGSPDRADVARRSPEDTSRCSVEGTSQQFTVAVATSSDTSGRSDLRALVRCGRTR
jgi:hypothetical protein